MLFKNIQNWEWTEDNRPILIELGFQWRRFRCYGIFWVNFLLFKTNRERLLPQKNRIRTYEKVFILLELKLATYDLRCTEFPRLDEFCTSQTSWPRYASPPSTYEHFRTLVRCTVNPFRFVIEASRTLELLLKLNIWSLKWLFTIFNLDWITFLCKSVEHCLGKVQRHPF